MTPAGLILAAAMAVSGADDPAVRVCEMLARISIGVPESFVREGTPVVDGRSVVVEFSERDRRGREKHGTRTCTFVRSDADGSFRIEALRRSYLELRLATARSKLRRTPPGNALQMVRSEIIDIGREMFVQDERRKQAEREASGAGIYPIAADKTGLR